MIKWDTEPVVDLARERVYWPHMSHDIEEYITQKCRCLKQDVPIVAPLQSLTSFCPGDLVIDHVYLETAAGRYEYILTITDRFTRLLQTYPLRNREAKKVAHHLCFHCMQSFGIPAWSLGKGDKILIFNVTERRGLEN